MLLVFTVSAVVHEYILAICFGFFYPVLFCLFMCFGSKNKKYIFLSPLKTCDPKQNCPICIIWESVHYTSAFISFLHHLTVMFNFILHDQRKGPIWNIIMWTSLFLGQGVIICLYSHEWYAQLYCPLEGGNNFSINLVLTKQSICCPEVIFLDGFSLIHLKIWVYSIYLVTSASCVGVSAFVPWVTEASLLELSERLHGGIWPAVTCVWTTAEDYRWSVYILKAFLFLSENIVLFYCTKVTTESVNGCREEDQ